MAAVVGACVHSLHAQPAEHAAPSLWLLQDAGKFRQIYQYAYMFSR